MKKTFFTVFAVLAIFALAMTGCPGGGETDGGGDGTDPNNPPVTPSTNVTLSTIVIGTGGPLTAPENDTRNAVLASLTKLKDVNLSNALKTDAEITLNLGTSFTGEAKIAKIAADAPISEADFTTTYTEKWSGTHPSPKPKFTFTDGDKLYAKLTAGDGTTVMYYGFKVNIGADASLKEEGGIIFTDVAVGRLGSPMKTEAELDDLSIDSEDLGRMQFPKTQPDTGFLVKTATSDEDATVKIKGGDKATYTAVPADGLQVKFNNDRDVLYVEVTSGNTRVVQYYKIILILKRVTDIKYGEVTNLGISDAGEALDSIWDSAGEWLPIDRANTSEGAGWLNMAENTRSHGRAKLLWKKLRRIICERILFQDAY